MPLSQALVRNANSDGLEQIGRHFPRARRWNCPSSAVREAEAEAAGIGLSGGLGGGVGMCVCV
jgi:hypothetical protein